MKPSLEGADDVTCKTPKLEKMSKVALTKTIFIFKPAKKERKDPITVNNYSADVVIFLWG